MESIGFIPLAKVDIPRREVWGWAAEERPDKSGEIMDYARSKPHFMEWSDAIHKASGGKSLGNVRSMHTNIAAGVLIALDPRDDVRKLYVGARIVDDQEWRKVESGVYTGFSIGGSYADRWPDPDNPLLKRYEAVPAEISLVDNPCMYGAQFEIVKADGLTEHQTFSPAGANTMSDTLTKQADANKIVAQLQTLRDECELSGDFEGAALYTQAIAQTLAAATGKADQLPDAAAVPEEEETPADEAAETPDEQAAEQAAGTEQHDPATGEPKADEEDKAMKGVNLPADRRELTAALKAYTAALVKSAKPELPADLIKAADLDAKLEPFAKLTDFQKIVGDVARVALALETLEKRLADVEQPTSGPVLREVGARLLVNDASLDDEAILKAAISNTADSVTKDILSSRLTRLQITKAQTSGNTISLPKP